MAKLSTPSHACQQPYIANEHGVIGHCPQAAYRRHNGRWLCRVHLRRARERDAAAQPAPAPVAVAPVDDATLWREYQAARARADQADGPAPTRADQRPRVETFRGRRLRVAKGREWGTVVQYVNGQPVTTVSGWDAGGLDRAAAQLRRDVIAADERRITDPDAYPAHWYAGAPEPDPAVVAYVRRAAERERADRAALAAPVAAQPAGFVSGWAALVH